MKTECQSPPLCYGCKKTGHLRRDWQKQVFFLPPLKLNRQISRADVRALQISGGGDNISMPLVAPSPTATITIGGVTTGCILDTGAEASLIPSRYYKEELKSAIDPLNCHGSGIAVVGMTGKVR